MPKTSKASPCEQEHAARFLERLRAEIMHHKDKRTTFILQKMAFITALFGAAALQLTDAMGQQIAVLDWVLYLVPFIAISYDIYIYAEDYKVKRVGTFIRTNAALKTCAGDCEREWETYVAARREPLATYATMVLTMMITGGAFLVLWNLNGGIRPSACILLGVGLALPIVLYGIYKLGLLRRL